MLPLALGIPVDGMKIHNYILTDQELFYMLSKSRCDPSLTMQGQFADSIKPQT